MQVVDYQKELDAIKDELANRVERVAWLQSKLVKEEKGIFNCLKHEGELFEMMEKVEVASTFNLEELKNASKLKSASS